MNMKYWYFETIIVISNGSVRYEGYIANDGDFPQDAARIQALNRSDISEEEVKLKGYAHKANFLKDTTILEKKVVSKEDYEIGKDALVS